MTNFPKRASFPVSRYKLLSPRKEVSIRLRGSFNPLLPPAKSFPLACSNRGSGFFFQRQRGLMSNPSNFFREDFIWTLGNSCECHLSYNTEVPYLCKRFINTLRPLEPSTDFKFVDTSYDDVPKSVTNIS